MNKRLAMRVAKTTKINGRDRMITALRELPLTKTQLTEIVHRYCYRITINDL